MDCYVISLQRAWERREHVTSEFGNVNLPFRVFDAIDGSRLTNEALSSVDRETRRKRVMQPLDNSALACCSVTRRYSVN